MRRVRIAWNKQALVPVASGFADYLPPDQFHAMIRKAESAVHPSFEISPSVFVELPSPGWRGGELLVYLPKRGWLVRRNKVEHWYVDIGVFKPIQGDLYGWTDLWLDVIAPEPADRYHLLDADEFASALRHGQVSADVAAYAMESLDSLVQTIRQGSFPPPEVREAEAFEASHHKSSSRSAGD